MFSPRLNFPPLRTIRSALLSLTATLFIGSANTLPARDLPPVLSGGTVTNNQLPLSWPAVSGRVYELQHVSSLTDAWSNLVSARLPLIATTSPLTVTVPVTGPWHFYRVKESPSPYDPPWATIAPLRTITIDPSAPESVWRAAIQALVPGDRLVFNAGTYTTTSKLSFSVPGTAAAPIWIEAAPDATVIIQRLDASQNILDLGSASYFALRGVEFTGGSLGLRLGETGGCTNVWIDRCKIHNTQESALTANSHHANHLYLTRNEIWETGTGTAEGMYLGSSDGSVTLSESIIALNHIHDTHGTAGSMAGIQVKPGSWGNLIAANRVHDVNGPCIILYTAGGKTPNIIENNLCYRTPDNAIQVTAECLVRNNLAMSGGTGGNSAFAGSINSGTPTKLTVVNNTFVNTFAAVRLSSWELGTNMVFANNACYSRSDMALRSSTTPAGVLFAGNLAYGPVAAGVGGFAFGTGLADFVNVTWDAAQTDARPAPGSPLLGAGAGAYAPATDFDFYPRTTPTTIGAYGP